MQEKKDNIKDTRDVYSDKSHQKLPKKISTSEYLDELQLLHLRKRHKVAQLLCLI